MRYDVPGRIAMIVSLGLVSVPAAFAQADTARVVVAGTVLDTERRPLEGVEVQIVGDSSRVYTSASGAFRLTARRSTEILLRLRKPGRNPQLLKLTGAWTGTVVMATGAFELPVLEVSARYAKPAEFAGTTKYDDVFWRHRIGTGELITSEEIARRAPLRTPDILLGRPGIRITRPADFGTAVAFARCHEYPPGINVYIDGHKQIPAGRSRSANQGNASVTMRRSLQGDPDVVTSTGEMLERVSPNEIEFVEIFRGPGELPAEFHDGNCGAIAIWTKQGAR